MNLFDEFLSLLYATKNKCEVLSPEEGKKIVHAFLDRYPLAWGRIDWSKIKHQEKINNIADIAAILEKNGKNFNNPIYIIWGDASLPIITCTISDVLNNIETAKFLGGPATFLYSPTQDFVIEFYHDGNVTLGFAEKEINKS